MISSLHPHQLTPKPSPNDFKLISTVQYALHSEPHTLTVPASPLIPPGLPPNFHQNPMSKTQLLPIDVRKVKSV